MEVETLAGVDVVVVDGVRTAVGTFGGRLKDMPAAELGALVVREALNRSGIEPEAVDEVILGCVGQVGADAYIARVAAVRAGVPVGSTAQTVNRLCGSGLQAMVTASQWLQLDDARVVVAGGAENMSRLPYYVWNRWGRRLGNSELEDGVLSAVADPFEHYAMGVTGEHVAERYGISREAQDDLAFRSQQRAQRAIADGLFAKQIVPVDVPGKRGSSEAFLVDEHPRDTTRDTLAALSPAFTKGGTVTAGNASGINDGAAAVVMTTAGNAAARGLSPRARMVSYGFAGIDPAVMGYAPVEAIRRALARAHLTLDDIDLIELNEAFASQACAVARDAGLDWERTNVNGGAIALGHPIGATGALLTVKLMHELARRGQRYGLVTMCIGGGQGIAAVFENLRR